MLSFSMVLHRRPTVSPDRFRPRPPSASGVDPLTPVLATDPRNRLLNSFLCHTSKNDFLQALCLPHLRPAPPLSVLPTQLSTFNFQPSYSLPYILPSSVSSNTFVFTLFTKLPGCAGILPILEPFSAILAQRGFRRDDAILELKGTEIKGHSPEPCLRT